ncbi:sugar transferase [Nocardioides sp. W3-2-3]|uniref:sugar transferase n=1 Tax=Nocardioides convexus TaxID=2712224 RepID=UPI0031010ABB|nr:sugar transferase [Nocardioides convexus]
MIRDANKVVAPIEAGRFLNTPADSPLYTPVGRILDGLGLNEIPQFIHVLKGEMSIVGARPLTDVVRDALMEQHEDLDGRWETPAGLTGLPQARRPPGPHRCPAAAGWRRPTPGAPRRSRASAWTS